jgi:transposase
MQYLGIDVHAKTSTWCLLDEAGEVKAQGQIETNAVALQRLCREQRAGGDLVVGQEVGGMAYLVRDALAESEVPLLSFNAQQMRMIAASRKKTDRRDAYWIGRSLQTGMHPHPVYLPSGVIRELRARLSQRSALLSDRQRWWLRARALLRSLGLRAGSGKRALHQALEGLHVGESVPAYVQASASLYQRQILALDRELARAQRALREVTKGIDAIERLQSIPGVGHLSATTIVAWVGEIERFPSARSLCAYAGLVPSVRQSGEKNHLGRITKTGARALRMALVQCAHAVVGRCRGEAAEPLQQIAERIRTHRGRRKIAIVALARHLLRIAYYVLRDETAYDPARVRG